MKRHKSLLLVGALASLLLSPPLTAEEGAPFTPLPRIEALSGTFLVARTNNVLKTLDDAGMLVDMVVPGMGMTVKAMALQSLFQDPTGMALARDLPSVVVVGNPKVHRAPADQPPIAIAIGADEAAAILMSFAQMLGGDTQAAADGTITLGNGGLLKIADRFVLLGNCRSLMDTVAAIVEADPNAFSGVPKGVNIDVVVDVKALREAFREEMENGTQEILRALNNREEIERQLGDMAFLVTPFLPVLTPIAAALPDLAAQFEGLRLLVTLDTNAQNAGLAVTAELYPSEASRLAPLVTDMFRPLDRASAMKAAARVPDGPMFTVGTASATELRKLMKDLSEDVRKSCEAAGVPVDPLVTLVFEKLMELAPSTTYSVATTMAVTGDTAASVSAVTPTDLTRDKMARVLRDANDALITSQAYLTALALGGDKGWPIPTGVRAEDIEGLEGVSVVVDLPPQVNPQTLEMVKSMYGDPPALHFALMDDVSMWYQGGGGVAGFKAVVLEGPGKPLSASTDLGAMLTRMPEGTSTLVGYRVLGLMLTQFRMMANNPMFGGMMGAMENIFSSFMANDAPIEIFLFRDQSVASVKAFIPTRSIANVAAAFRALQMQRMGIPQPGPDGFGDEEEDLPF